MNQWLSLFKTIIFIQVIWFGLISKSFEIYNLLIFPIQYNYICALLKVFGIMIYTTILLYIGMELISFRVSQPICWNNTILISIFIILQVKPVVFQISFAPWLSIEFDLSFIKLRKLAVIFHIRQNNSIINYLELEHFWQFSAFDFMGLKG